jgi:hypothetical protein
MGRFLVFGLLIAAGGLAMTVAGFGTDDPANLYYQFRWFGPILLSAGIFLIGLTVYLARR